MHRVPRRFNDEVVDEIAPGVHGLGPDAGSTWLEVPVAQFRHQPLGLTCIESLRSRVQQLTGARSPVPEGKPSETRVGED